LKEVKARLTAVRGFDFLDDVQQDRISKLAESVVTKCTETLAELPPMVQKVIEGAQVNTTAVAVAPSAPAQAPAPITAPTPVATPASSAAPAKKVMPKEDQDKIRRMVSSLQSNKRCISCNGTGISSGTTGCADCAEHSYHRFYYQNGTYLE
jgi:hypothetical protein